MRRFVLVDHTSGACTPPDGTLEAIAQAITDQVARHLAPAWGFAPVEVALHGRGEKVHIFNAANEEDLGWHEVMKTTGGAFAHVAAAPSLAGDSTWLSGPDAISASISHEVLEMIVDPNAHDYSFNGQRLLFAREVCDPVSSRTYLIRGAGKLVAVSDFVLPAYFNPFARRPFDHLDALKAPFTLDHGGYIVTNRVLARNDGEHQRGAGRFRVSFRGVPQWKQDHVNRTYSRSWWRRTLHPSRA
jgi:hypothetical protein